MIDDHAHPFALRTADFHPAEVTLDIAPRDAAEATRRQVGPGWLAAEMMAVRLARHLGCRVSELTTAAAAKSVLAYRTGLAVDRGVDSGGRPVPAHRAADPPLRQGVAHLLFRRILARSTDLGLPLQVHRLQGLRHPAPRGGSAAARGGAAYAGGPTGQGHPPGPCRLQRERSRAVPTVRSPQR